jgi:hypothetical protein
LAIVFSALLRFKDFIAPLISSNIPFMEAIII